MTDPLRIPPLLRADRDDRTNEALDEAGLGGDSMNLFSTLAHHPKLLRRWAAFGGMLLFGGTLPERDREILILRTSTNTGADYEWGHHVSLGSRAGLGDDEMRSLAGDASALDGHDRLLVTAADELHRDSVISDGTWASLAEVYDQQQLIELCMLVGQYHLVGFTLRSLGVEREDGVPEIPNLPDDPADSTIAGESTLRGVSK